MNDNDNEANFTNVSSMENIDYNITTEPNECSLLQINMEPSYLQGESINESHQNNFYEDNHRFLSCSYSSKEDFVKEYKQFCYGEKHTEELYVLVLIELVNTVLENNVDDLKKLTNFISYINSIEEQITLRGFYSNISNPLKNTNLVILACKCNNVRILEYLFDNNELLINLTVNIGKNCILPNDEDESCHNAFYYAIRSGNVQLLDTVVNKWPGNYFTVHLMQLDEIISRAYEELKLKNVPLLEDMSFFVENILINIRFCSNASKRNQNVKHRFNNIRQRIDLVLQNICLLRTEYSNGKTVNEKFVFIVKFLAQNIHILKRQLKSTYDRVPWEEMEFCLISFVFYHVKQQEINLFYRFTLDQITILNHLQNFAKKLEDLKHIIKCKDINKLAQIPNVKRETVVNDIIKNNPEFEVLYSDYQQIKDIHSLDRISNYIQLGLSANPKHSEGRLIITRVLQVIGEYLKNTLESPNLSDSISELLLLSLPKNTRKVIIDLRNSFSHAYSLSKRTEIENNTDYQFFIGVQNDTKRIASVINDIFNENKLKIIKLLLKKIINSECLSEVNEVIGCFSNMKLDNKIEDCFKLTEHEKLEKLIQELSDTIVDKTSFELELFNKINNIINYEKTKSENSKINYVKGFALLKTLINNTIMHSNANDHHNIFRGLKWYANKIIENFFSQVELHSLKDIAELVTKIFYIAEPRLQNDDSLEEVIRLTSQIRYIAEIGTRDLGWIKKLRNILNNKDNSISLHKDTKVDKITEENYNIQLTLKLSKLKNVLVNNALNEKLPKNMPSYKVNKMLQAVIEMLVLDILSILCRSDKRLENNLFYLDDFSPILTGKFLRNHLAHDNVLVDLILTDSSTAIILNAKKLISENMLKSTNKFGKMLNDDLSKLKHKYDQNLITITNQDKMFIALEEGNIDKLKCCLREGADINAKTTMSWWTTLHFAAKGPSLEVVKYIIDQNLKVNAKDVNGQSPLHIAAAHGREKIVDYFLKQIGMYVDDLDKNHETPLHIAAKNGNKDTVAILLKNNANTNIKNVSGLSPVHYATMNNHIDVVRILLEKEANVDINETLGGFTSLHMAAERGHLKIVNFLLRKGANVNAKNEMGGIPLHTASFNGHQQIVNALILKGADVNPRSLDGLTPLHNAVENGHGKIANILVKHGANVNAVDKRYNYTALHYATEDGHEEIVKMLLKNKADTRIVTVENMTALHLATFKGHLQIISILIEYGVNIHAKNKQNATSLHIAAQKGHMEVVKLLIKSGANINDKINGDLTPLHLAALGGHKNIVELLIRNKDLNINYSTILHAAAQNGSIDTLAILLQNKAKINARNNMGFTPLHIAVINGHKDAVAFLIKNNAVVNTVANNSLAPLHSAILKGHIDILILLIANKAKVNVQNIAGTKPLHLALELPLPEAGMKEEVIQLIAIAMFIGNEDIVEVLLKMYPVNLKNSKYALLLPWAAKKGFKEIVKYLITNGVNVNVSDSQCFNMTPLYLASGAGYEEIVEILVANGANVNVLNLVGTPLHIAAGRGHNNIVQFLLNNGANIYIKDTKNRTSIELAVAQGHLEVVKTLLQYKKINMNAKSTYGWTILHIASQEKISQVEMIKFLVDEGCDINAKNDFGSKPVHIAARQGNIDIVEFFLSKGLSINEFGLINQTLLHYATMGNQLNVVKYLIAQGADINAKDSNGSTPMHFAAIYCEKEVIEILLDSHAIYNAADKHCQRPLDLTNKKDIQCLLALTGKLFESVKYNSILELENNVKAGACINAKSADDVTPLHFAAWKGYNSVVKFLLKNKANPNTVGKKGFTPLHYAVKFSHLKVVKTLLSHGATYNTPSDNGTIPSDFAVDGDINNLFKLINVSFKRIIDNDPQVINDLNKITDIDIVKVVMRACNKEGRTLIVAAIHSNFLQVEQLKQISQNDILQLDTAFTLSTQGNYQKALSIFRTAYEKRKNLLGSHNPGTLDIQKHIATVLYKQGNYQQALGMMEEIFQKQKGTLGLNEKDTLNTKSLIALILYRQGKDEEALNIYEEIYPKQKQILGPSHTDTIETEFHKALLLNRQGKYEEALHINKSIFGKREKTLGANNIATVIAKNNIALVLASQGKYEESLKIYEEVFDKKKTILGINHTDTLRTLHNIAGIFLQQKKYQEALKTYHEVLRIQKKTFQQNHPETVHTQYNIANVLYDQGKWMGALKIYREIFDQSKTIFGPNHPVIIGTTIQLEIINMKLKLQGIEESEIIQYLQKDINSASSKGELETVERLLKNGVDPNDYDIDGRTPLHYAINNGHVDIVNILLKYGADVTQVTNKGNTPLHTATCKNNKEIIKILLEHISRDKLNAFLNAKTTSTGTTSIHVAAKNGSLEIIKYLLKYGAVYNIENNEGKIPINLSKNQGVINFLKLIEEMFEKTKNGNVDIINMLTMVNQNDFLSVMKARNKQGQTLMQVAVANKHRSIADKLSKMLELFHKEKIRKHNP